MRRTLSSALVAAVLTAFGTASHPAAQQPAPAQPPAPPPSTPAPQAPGAPAPRPAPGEVVEAPIVRFAPEGITLDTAVRMTLQYEPNIRRQDAAVEFQGGVAQEQAGPFDYTLQGGVQYQRRIQELSESRKQNEIDKRARLDSVIQDNATSVANAQRLIPLLQQLATAPPGQEPIDEIRKIDPATADMLQLFDDLIKNNANNPTVQADLIRARSSFVQTTLGKDFQKSLQDQIDSYNAAKVSRANLGDAPVDEVFYNTTLQVSISKLFRSGIQFSPFFDGARDGTNFAGKPQDAEFGGKGLKDVYTFHAGTGVAFPLLRNRGSVSVAAAERAAQIEHDASRLNAQHQAAVSSLQTILAYWDLRAAQDNLDAIRKSSALQTDLLNLTQQLITGGELPRAELARSQAADARARAQLEDAQRQLHQARVALATAMGVSATGDDDTLPLAHDPFPAAPDTAAVQGAPTLVAPSPSQRLDLSAAIREQEAGRVAENAAAVNVQSRLDLSTSTWYTAIAENSVSRAVSRWVGPSTQLSLQLERPFGNNVLRGQLVERQADTRSREIAAVDLQRQIRLGVLQASSTLADAVDQVKQAEAAVGFYGSIYEADVQRYRTGEATLIDTVITQQQQTEALLALTSARNSLAHLIAQLRFQSGTLLPPGVTPTPDRFVTVPPAIRVGR